MSTSTKAGHTPGPWHLVKHGDGENEQYNVDGVSNCGDAVTLAVVQNGGMDWEEFEANARLIAAAPALLAELKAMVRAWENGWKVDKEVYLDNARAVIALAEGGSNDTE